MDKQILFKTFEQQLRSNYQSVEFALNLSPAARQIRAKAPELLLPELFWHLKNRHFSPDDVRLKEAWAMFITTYAADEHLSGLEKTASFEECLQWLEEPKVAEMAMT